MCALFCRTTSTRFSFAQLSNFCLFSLLSTLFTKNCLLKYRFLPLTTSFPNEDRLRPRYFLRDHLQQKSRTEQVKSYILPTYRDISWEVSLLLRLCRCQLRIKSPKIKLMRQTYAFCSQEHKKTIWTPGKQVLKQITGTLKFKSLQDVCLRERFESFYWLPVEYAPGYSKFGIARSCKPSPFSFPLLLYLIFVYLREGKVRKLCKKP